MISLYQWLIDERGYSEAEAEETVLRREVDLDLPEEVLIDVREYTQVFIQTFKG